MLGLGQTMFGLREPKREAQYLVCVPSRLVEVGEPFCAPSAPTPSANANAIARSLFGGPFLCSSGG